MQPRRFLVTRTQIMRTTTSRVTRVALPISGVLYPSSSIFASSAMHNTELHTLTILSNTCKLPFYACRCTLCVDPLQARPSVAGNEAGMAKHAPLISYVFVSLCVYYLLPATSLYGHRLLQQSMYVYTEHRMTCSIFGTTVTVFFLCSIRT